LAELGFDGFKAGIGQFGDLFQVMLLLDRVAQAPDGGQQGVGEGRFAGGGLNPPHFCSVRSANPARTGLLDGFFQKLTSFLDKLVRVFGVFDKLMMRRLTSAFWASGMTRSVARYRPCRRQSSAGYRR
jgi:hypothetical protein